MESEVRDLADVGSGTDEAGSSGEASIATVDNTGSVAGEKGGNRATMKGKESEAFVNRLKERIKQKEDLIARLKHQSEKDVDPGTGKVRTMTAKEYKERA